MVVKKDETKKNKANSKKTSIEKNIKEFFIYRGVEMRETGHWLPCFLCRDAQNSCK